jgi:plastocyanin
VPSGVNEEEFLPHDVTSGVPGAADAGPLFASPLLQPGETFSFTFEQTGTYDYFCVIHPRSEPKTLAFTHAAP